MWPGNPTGGATVMSGRERDGVFVTEDRIVLIEATVERTKKKAEKDGKKLNQLALQYGRSHPVHAVKAFFVTPHEPLADQRDAINRFRNSALTAISFNTLRSMLVDAVSYLDARGDHPFGSARRLDVPTSFKDLGPYVGLDILETTADGSTWDVDGIAEALLRGTTAVLLGDFGAGKSMTMREVFLRLAIRYRKRDTNVFPVHLNLGEHLGQIDPGEALTRHGRSIGYERPNQLVRAWKSGYVVLLLDGFDEMAATNWSGDVKRLREARRRAVRLVREIEAQRPSDSGLLVAGREHYFDNAGERRDSLGCAVGTTDLSLNDFSDAQVSTYLAAKEVPSWLPRRPYLLGYLAARRLLPLGDDALPPAEGWDRLADGICEREARAEVGIEGATVRRVLERLSSLARTTADGLGPLSFDDVSQAFRDVVGHSPDEGALVLLQRLPGLGVADPVTGTRRFIDGALADVMGAGDPFHFILAPYAAGTLPDPTRWSKALGSLGADVLARRVREDHVPPGAQVVAIERAGALGWDTLAFDIVQAVDASGGDINGPKVTIEGVWVEELSLGYSEGSFQTLELTGCVIQTLDVNAPLDRDRTPLFVSCDIGLARGVSSDGDLPGARFRDNSFAQFSEETSTTQGILRMRLPLTTRVGLTILKKLYLQRGSGRKDSALRRGLDEKARDTVDEVLRVLQAEGLVLPSKIGKQPAWLPVRGAWPRAHLILSRPLALDDAAIHKLNELRRE